MDAAETEVFMAFNGVETLAHGANPVENAGNIIHVTATNLTSIAGVTGTITFSANTHAGDGLPMIWFDSDDKFMQVGLWLNDDATDATLDTPNSFLPMANVPMTAAQYGNIHANNFDFV